MNSEEPAASDTYSYGNQSKKPEYSTIATAAPIAFCSLDTRFRYMHLNQILADMNGTAVKDHIGKTPWDIVPDLGEQAERAMQRILATGEPLLNYEISGETKAQPGVTRYWMQNWIPTIDYCGKIDGISVTGVEITGMKTTQLTLQENGIYLTNEQLKRLRNRRGMINVLADMMTDSISVVKSTLNLLENNPADQKLVRHGLKTAKSEQRRVEYFANCIAEIIAEKKIPIKKEPIELCAILRQAAAAYSTKLREAKIEFHADIPSTPIFIDADPAELRRILDNMLHLIILLLLPREKATLIVYEDSGTSRASVVIHLMNTQHQINIIPLIATKDFPELNYDMMKQIMVSHGGRFEVKIDEIGINPQFIFRFPKKAAKKK